MSPNTVHIAPDARAISADRRIVAAKREPQRVRARRRGRSATARGTPARSTPAARAASMTSRCLRTLRRDVTAPHAICAAATSIVDGAFGIIGGRGARRNAKSSSGASRHASDESLLLQERLRDVLDGLLVDVDAGVEPRHRRVVELRRQRVQVLGELRDSRRASACARPASARSSGSSPCRPSARRS